MMKHYLALEAIFQKAKNLSAALQLLEWDRTVFMPAGNIDTRTEQMVTLSTLVNQLITSPETQEQLAAVELKELDEWQRANFQRMQWLSQWTAVIPEELMQAFTRATSKCEMIWRTMRETSNYQEFTPYFQEVLDRVREIATIRAQRFNCSIYEACTANYNPGIKADELELLFTQLQDFLPNFIQEAIEVQKSHFPSISVDSLTMDLESQKSLNLKVMDILGFDFNKGRFDTSVHPFCYGIQGDVRITTRYSFDDFTGSLFGTIHETGHALYEQGLPKEWVQQPVGEPVGMAIHESQSLTMEMQVGRSQEFLNFLAQLLEKECKEHKPELTADNLFKVLNQVNPSLIRVDADEATYSAHVVMRYKLEQAMLNSELSIKDLPAAWDESMQKMLGIKPNNHKEGCMQDIHWPSGAFGYFPSYTMGAIIAAQLFATIKLEIPGIMSNIEQGNFKQLKTWLHEKIHKFGRKYTTDELLYKATGKKLDLTTYCTYLQNKFIHR